ncbi:MAG: RNA-binding transcriptional accessory protein [Saprospiraceae bacterium]|nr:RNA-binding transcriptional accessory protein [Saprospiraceae bacterium]MDW8485093.1 Tex family protein [Saprospiraceae bacterium]
MTARAQSIGQALGISPQQVEAVLKLLENGATIPFIARYRKEATGSLDEVRIAEIQSAYKRLEELDRRRAVVLQSIEEQGKLTPELRAAILAASTPTDLEDLYLPYRPKRKTRGTVAIERGLEPLARRLLEQPSINDLEALAQPFLNGEVPTVADALQGARDILAEWIGEDRQTRDCVRRHFERSAHISARVVKGKERQGAKYRDYFAWNEPLAQCPSHRILAMFRGENEGYLRLTIAPQDEGALSADLRQLWVKGSAAAAQQVQMAVEDAYKRLLQPAIETEFRHLAKQRADAEAIRVFADNLRQLLLAPPLGERRVLAIDPGFRTGCKVVVLDANGNLLEHTTIYPHEPQRQVSESRKTLVHLVEMFQVEAIAVGDGTAGRETMELLRHTPFERPVEFYLVSEAGASVYSASAVAREELPDYDVTVRGAVSIGRRLMDPLAELVKIDPKSIGVGQYQHDVNQTLLREALDRTVESCVNAVGVNLNTASKHLLSYVSGLGPALAQNIVTYRTKHGPFRSREELKKVPRLGAKAFEQCAGFLRIRNAENPLDNTGIHPERYALVAQMARDLGCSLNDLIADKNLRKSINLKRYISGDVGLPTLQDILRELDKPGLDPRGSATPFEFADVHHLEDLTPGMILPGIVTNITNFGVFVDIGLKISGLVHISQLSNRFVQSPADIVKLHQTVRVRVLEVDAERQRIALSMRDI